MNSTVGFGTAALGSSCYNVVTMALKAGFRRFDTAEADWWYDQAETGRALQDYFQNSDCDGDESCSSCFSLEVSTKIPPWKLWSPENIRGSAAQSRNELLGFCPDQMELDDGQVVPYALDIYYIHAPTCWDGWHPRCKDHPPLLPLRESWQAMEAVVGLDRTARRIGLSNVHPNELLDIIHFVEERQKQPTEGAPPRKPDVVQAYADPLHPATELRQICRQYGIEFVSYSTLGTQHRQGSNPVLGSPMVHRLATKHQRSIAEVVLSWALQHNMSVIPRSSKWAHIQELARLLDNRRFLDADDMREMDGMSVS